jgi:alpha-tubulin suppressor-like RCC1 family protein
MTKTDGTLWAMGFNSGRALGLGDNTWRSSPTQVGALTIWKDVKCCAESTLALHTNGTMWGWGRNTYGESGLGVLTFQDSPIQVGTASDWKQIDSNFRSSIALKIDGSIYTFGYNFYGQLGQGDNTTRNTPVQLGSDSDWKFINMGIIGSAIKNSGALFTWGDNQYGGMGVGDTIRRSSPVQVGSDLTWKDGVLGGNGTLFFRKDIATGTINTWGDGSSYVLGRGDTIDRSSPTQVGDENTWIDISIDQHTHAINSEGELWTWGYNANGTCGLGTTQAEQTTVSLPEQVGSDTDWLQASVNNICTLAIKTDGTLWAWGGSTYGIQGTGDFVQRSSPSQVGTDTDWSYVFISELHATALKTDGGLYTWGYNNAGQLGHGDQVNRSTPTQVGSDSWKKVSCSTFYTGAIKSDGTLWTWGNNIDGALGQYIDYATVQQKSSPAQVGGDNDWVEIACNGYFGLAVKLDGTLWAWGRNTSRQLGLGDTLARSSPVQIGALNDWAKVANAHLSSYAIKQNGSLWSWGEGGSGQLGLGNQTDYASPVQVGSEVYHHISAPRIAPGSGYWVGGIQKNTTTGNSGKLVVLGENINGIFGLGLYYGEPGGYQVSYPTQVGFDDANWIDAEVAGLAIGVKEDGTLWTWGRGSSGGLGRGVSFETTSYPTQVGTDTNWSSCSMNGGIDFAAALRSDGTLWTWGSNSTGQLGHGDTTNKSSPTQVGTDTDWIKVRCGGFNSMAAIKQDGTLWTWGNGSYGNTGHGDTANRSTPIQVGDGTTWVDIKPSEFGYIALTSEGTIWAWGYNARGQLGQGDIVSRSTPTQIGSDTNWNSIGRGGSHFMATKTDGTLWAWGFNNIGQLGIGSTLAQSSPIQVGSDTNWASAQDGGSNFSYAIKQDGTLWGAGFGGRGTLNRGLITSPNTITQLGTDTDWIQIKATEEYNAFGIKGSV